MTARRTKTKQKKKKKWAEKLRPRPESGKDEFECWFHPSCETGATIWFQGPFYTPRPFHIPKETDQNLGTLTNFLVAKVNPPSKGEVGLAA